MSELVSVVIPAYNCSLTIKRCIDSIINQTYNEIEILIINDGSTDNTLKILREYEKEDNRIKIFDIINKGVSNARNVGIKNSIGRYIIFIDSVVTLIASSVVFKETIKTQGYIGAIFVIIGIIVMNLNFTKVQN